MGMGLGSALPCKIYQAKKKRRERKSGVWVYVEREGMKRKDRVWRGLAWEV